MRLSEWEQNGGDEMSGYRLDDDDWSRTNEVGEPITGGWIIIVAFFGVLIIAILAGVLVPLVLVATFVGIPTLCIWNIVSGLRTGVVRINNKIKVQSYSRTKDPFYYWSLLAGLTALAAYLIYLFAMVFLNGH